jgi:branched-chain amino acid transport system permease protein
MRCVRDDELAAGSLGIPTMRVKLLAFTIGAAFCSVSGWLYSLAIPYLDPTVLSADESILILVMLVVGGSGSGFGAAIGAGLVSLVPELLRPLHLWWPVIFGAIVILAISLGRNGLAGVRSELIALVSRALSPGRVSVPDQGTFKLPGYYKSLEKPQDLEVTGLSKRFGGLTALDQFSTSFRAGTIHAVIGPNGSGKSTLVNVMTGVYKPDAGTVSRGGMQLTGLSNHQIARRGVVRTFQHSRPFAGLTVHENMLPALEIVGWRAEEAGREVPEHLRIVGLDGTQDRPATTLSYGQQRLLEVARAIALQPMVLILDEPAAGLAGQLLPQLARLVRDFADQGRTVILIEHNVPWILGLADVVSVLHVGRKIAEGTPAEIVVMDEVREAYLGSGAAKLPQPVRRVAPTTDA